VDNLNDSIDTQNNMTLPLNILEWLHARGISDAVIAANGIDWNGTHIVIPIKNKDGAVLFNKYRRDPFGPTDQPKYKYEPGTTAQLFNAHKIAGRGSVIICEGEMDALRLESAGYLAVTTTGGAGTFRDEWLELLRGKDLYVCYDNDDAGIKGAVKLLTKIEAKMVLIPRAEEVKDVTDYLKIGGSFPILLERAESFPFLSEPVPEFKFIKDVEEYKKKVQYNIERIMVQEQQARQGNKPFRHLDAVREMLLVALNNLDREIRKLRYFRKEAEVPGNEDGRITNEDVLRAKESPIDVLYGDRLRKIGNKAYGKCPFHNEKTGSFVIYLDQNKFYCFGCSAGTDAIDYVMRRDDCDFITAVKKLINKT